jgi:DNA-binding PadR family transcriptional regulator
MGEKGAKDNREANPEVLLPLTTAELNILLSLIDGQRHIYGIIQEVERRTGGKTRLGHGGPYRAIRRMLEDGLVEESDERPDPGMDDGRRRYYCITGFGRRVTSAEVTRLEELVKAARDKGIRPAP